ncbi:MAG: helix-turn-helix domain-containing protein [Cyanobacteria bacterium J069]
MLDAMSKGLSPLEQEQVLKLAELGYELHQLRERQMLSVDQLSARTMIQPRVIRAIESGDFKELPEPVYIRGFLRRYADALGLDGHAFSEEFPLEPQNIGLQPSWQETPEAQLRPLHLYLAYVGLIAAAIAGLSYVWSRSTTPITAKQPSPTPALIAPPTTASSPTAAPSSTTAQPGQSPAAQPVAIASPSPNPSPSAPAKPVRVDVTLREQSWLRVTVDGRTDFEGMLQAGTQRTWAADREVRIRAGNAGGVIVSYNEQEAKPIGKPGAVQSAVFPPPSGQTGAQASAPSAQANSALP